jgi:hypothetical protein
LDLENYIVRKYYTIPKNNNNSEKETNAKAFYLKKEIKTDLRT